MTTMTNHSQSFKDRMPSASLFESYVASTLASKGLTVLHHPTNLTNGDYSQSADLSILERGDLRDPSWNHIEVKSINRSFTGVNDYPFNEVMVCSQSSFLKKFPGLDKTGRDFLFASRVTGAILWLPAWSRVTMGHEVFDRSRNELYKVVKAQKSDLRELSDFVEGFLGSRE